MSTSSTKMVAGGVVLAVFFVGVGIGGSFRKVDPVFEFQEDSKEFVLDSNIQIPEVKDIKTILPPPKKIKTPKCRIFAIKSSLTGEHYEFPNFFEMKGITRSSFLYKKVKDICSNLNGQDKKVLLAYRWKGGKRVSEGEYNEEDQRNPRFELGMKLKKISFE